jgi:hypothetical protein
LEEKNRQQREAEEYRSRITTELAAAGRAGSPLEFWRAGWPTKAEVASVRLHPQLAELYRARVAALEEALNDDADRAEAQGIIRALIDRVVLQPATDGGMQALLYGELAGMPALGEDGTLQSKRPGRSQGVASVVSVVAGAGCHLYRTEIQSTL